MPVYKTLTLRPNATAWILTHIAPSTCHHLDVHLLDTGRPLMAFLLVARAGGRTIKARRFMNIMGNGTTSPLVPDTVIGGIEHWQERTLNGRWMAARPQAIRDCVNKAHWGTILPICNDVRRAHKSYSIVLHYIRAPSLDPTESMMNYYEGSARGIRDNGHSDYMRGVTKHPLDGLL